MEEIIKKLFNKYSEEYVIPEDLKVKVSIVEDLKKAADEFSQKYKKNIFIDNLEYNGIICIPNKIDEYTEIFILKKEVDNYKLNNCQFVCTFFHELTHAIDYYNYCKKYCDNNYNEFSIKKSFYGFKMWSEFNAKRISYLLYCQFMNGDLYNSEEALKMIIDTELPFQNQFITDNLPKSNSYVAIYNIILYLGRYYVWECLFEEKFKNGAKFPKLLSEKATPEIIDLYNMLKKQMDSEEYYYDLQKCINLLKGKLINEEII